MNVLDLIGEKAVRREGDGSERQEPITHNAVFVRRGTKQERGLSTREERSQGLHLVSRLRQLGEVRERFPSETARKFVGLRTPCTVDLIGGKKRSADAKKLSGAQRSRSLGTHFWEHRQIREDSDREPVKHAGSFLAR